MDFLRAFNDFRPGLELFFTNIFWTGQTRLGRKFMALAGF
jgi:hypothetical protein